MATISDLRELEADVPWDRGDFRAELAALRESTAAASQRWAADLRAISRAAAMVPRCKNDERGGTPWTSFCREIAVARSCSDMAAASEIRAAQLIVHSMPRTLGLLDTGALTVQRARAFVTEVESLDEALVLQIDKQLADRVSRMQPWRIVQEVRRAVARLDPDAAAMRAATKNGGRGVSLSAESDEQARIEISGPAVPSTRWFATLDARARAAKQAGDPRTLDQLRFDLATSTYPCASHVPSDSTAPDEPAADSSADLRDEAAAPAGLRPAFVDPADTDAV